MTIATDCLQSVIRMHFLAESLGIARRDPRDQPWLHLGALALVLADDVPGQAAGRLRDTAIELACGDNGAVMRAGVRFQAAGILAQAGLHGRDMAVQYRRFRDFRVTEPAVTSSTIDAMCAITLLICSPQGRIRIPDMTRFEQLQRQLPVRLNGASDSFAQLLSASLVHVPLESVVLVQRFRSLRCHLVGITGQDVRATCLASVILLPAALSACEQVQRFADLFRAIGSDPQAQLLPILSLLAPLPYDPWEIVEHLGLCRDALASFGMLRDAASDNLLIGGLAYATMLHGMRGIPTTPVRPIATNDQRQIYSRFHAACIGMAACAGLPD